MNSLVIHLLAIDQSDRPIIQTVVVQARNVVRLWSSEGYIPQSIQIPSIVNPTVASIWVLRGSREMKYIPQSMQIPSIVNPVTTSPPWPPWTD